jgi:hypothetical protein
MFSREPKVRLSDVAVFIAAAKELFEAGVEAAKPGPIPEQYMLTPKQILEEQERMEAEAGWVLNGEGGEDNEPDED